MENKKRELLHAVKFMTEAIMDVVNPNEHHPVADGLVRVLRRDGMIKKEMLSLLSPRARHALISGKIRFMSEVTESNIEFLPGVGEKTRKEILEWKSNLAESN